MRKITLILLVFVILVLVNACQKVSEQKAKETGKETKPLSDIQITACNTAHEAGTCDTRLPELGIVLKEDCCEVLGKCC